MSKREINLMPDTQQALAKMGANIRKEDCVETLMQNI